VSPTTAPSNTPLWPEIPGHDKSSTYALHAQLLFTQWMNSDRFQLYQLRQLENLLRFAGRNSNYLASRLKFLENLSVGGLYAEHLPLVPVMSSSELQENSQKIIVRKRLPNHGKPRTAKIPKSKGPPVKMMFTGLLDSWHEALNLRSLDWHASDVSTACLRIDRNPDKKKSASGRRWSILPWSGRLHVVSADRPAGEQLEELVRINPGSLQTEPDILQSLMTVADLHGIKPENLKEIRCRGQSLDPQLRELAEKAWGVSIVHEYFVEEIGLIAIQCPSSKGLHINSEFVFVEILDEQDKPCTAGQTGRVVVTPIQNFQSPLIRYDTGDLAEVGRPCACGRTLPVLERILS
jgi:phenylacetate-CoA ligase